MVVGGLSLGAMLFDLSQDDAKICDNAIMICSNGIVAAQASSSFYLSGKTLRQICMKKTKSKVGVNEEEHGLKIVKEIHGFDLISGKNLVGPNNSYMPEDCENFGDGFRSFNEMRPIRFKLD